MISILLKRIFFRGRELTHQTDLSITKNNKWLILLIARNPAHIIMPHFVNVHTTNECDYHFRSL